MTSALPPSIWWERPPSFWNLRGCAPCRGGGDRPASGSLCWERRTGTARGAPSTARIGLGRLGPPPPPPRGRTEGRTPSRGRLTLSDAGATSPKA